MYKAFEPFQLFTLPAMSDKQILTYRQLGMYAFRACANVHQQLIISWEEDEIGYNTARKVGLQWSRPITVCSSGHPSKQTLS